MCDFLSRNAFNERIQEDTEQPAKDAFSKMDLHLDLFLSYSDACVWDWSDYSAMALPETVLTLAPRSTVYVADQQWNRQEPELYRE